MGYESESGPGGRIRTRTGSVLSGVPLLLGYAGEKMVLPVGIAPTTRRFEAGRSVLLSYGSFKKWCAGAVLPRLPPQCRCGDLLLIYRRVMPRAVRGDEVAAPDGFAPSTSRFKVGRSAG